MQSLLEKTAENLRAGVEMLLDLEDGRYTPRSLDPSNHCRFVLEALETDLGVLNDCIREIEQERGIE